MNELYGTRSLREIARILFQHWFMLILIVAVGTAGTWVYCDRFAPRKYRSRVSLIFKRPTNKSPISTDVGERALEVFVKAQQQIVMSDLVLARAKVISEDKALREKWSPIGKSVREGGGGRSKVEQFFRAGGDVDVKVRQLLTAGQEAFEKFRRSVELETPGGEQVAMTESFTLIVDRPGDRGDPAANMNAMHAAELLADMYMVRYQSLQEELNAPAVRVLDDVIGHYKKEVLAGVEKTYQDFVDANPGDIGVLEQLLKSGTEHGVQIFLSKIRENTATLQMDLEREKAVHTVLMEVLPEAALTAGGIGGMSAEEVALAIASVPVSFLDGNVVFVELTKNLEKLEGKLANIKAQFQDESRDVKYLVEELDTAKRRLLAIIASQALGLAESVKAREKQVLANAGLMVENEQRQNDIHRKLVAYAQIKNDFQVAEEHLAELQRQRIDAISNSTRAREAVTISRLNAASTPDAQRPLSPKTVLLTIVAFLVSSLLAIAFVFFLDHFDHTLRSSVEAERYLGIPVLGSVKKRGRRLVVSA